MKKFWVVFAFGLLLIGYTGSVHAESHYKIKHKDHVAQEWEIHVEYPLFEKLASEKLEKNVNNQIVQKLEDTFRDVRRVANESFGIPVLYYEEVGVYKQEGFYSVVMTTHISRGDKYQSTVTSINFQDDKSGKIQSLKEIADMNKLNKAVRAELAEDPDNYFHQTFQEVRGNTAYYIEDEQLTLVFNKFEIAAGVHGTPEIQVPLKKVEKETKADETNAPFPAIT